MKRKLLLTAGLLAGCTISMMPGAATAGTLRDQIRERGENLGGGGEVGDPCFEPIDCQSGLCLVLEEGEEGFCTDICDEATPCPEGFECVQADETVAVCVPEDIVDDGGDDDGGDFGDDDGGDFGDDDGGDFGDDDGGDFGDDGGEDDGGDFGDGGGDDGGDDGGSDGEGGNDDGGGSDGNDDDDDEDDDEDEDGGVINCSAAGGTGGLASALFALSAIGFVRVARRRRAARAASSRPE